MSTITKAPWQDTDHTHDFWLGTNGGNSVDLLNPSPESLSLEDMATALGQLCRFNGQIKQFYSVAEHCLNVAALVPPRYKLEALMHDAPEAYLCDVPTPLKKLLGAAYKDVESRLAAAIGIKFGLDLEHLPACVKAADLIMVVTERDNLQDCPLRWPAVYEDSLRSPHFRNRFGSIAGPEWLRQVKAELRARDLLEN
jgi:hypothetical protein